MVSGWTATVDAVVGCSRPAAERTGHERQADDERRSLVLAAALRLDGAAVQLDELFHDRQAEPEPAVRARRRRIGLAKALEQIRQELGLDADA